MPLVSHAKGLWRKSIHLHEPFNLHNMGQDAAARHEDPVTLAIIGCGQRGSVRPNLSKERREPLLTFAVDFVAQNYAEFAITDPTKCKVVAIAEPRPKTQKNFAATHNVDQTLVFDSWQDLHKASADTIKTVGKRLADAVVVAVQDQMHTEVVLAFAEQGYHILCEKPMSTNLDDCLKMEYTVKNAGIVFGMGHGMF